MFFKSKLVEEDKMVFPIGSKVEVTKPKIRAWFDDTGDVMDVHAGLTGVVQFQRGSLAILHLTSDKDCRPVKISVTSLKLVK